VIMGYDQEFPIVKLQVASDREDRSSKSFVVGSGMGVRPDMDISIVLKPISKTRSKYQLKGYFQREDEISVLHAVSIQAKFPPFFHIEDCATLCRYLFFS
jgi:hypothetical protein